MRPIWKWLADAYTMSDNYHQGGPRRDRAPIYIMMGHRRRDLVQRWGGQFVPPHLTMASNPATPGTPLTGNSSAPLSEIRKPRPAADDEQLHTQDGYGGGSGSPTAVAPNANYGGGAYVNCFDSTQHGVGAVTSYLAALKPSIQPHCQAGHYYLVNNYNPGYFGDGTNAYTDTNPANTSVYEIPPSECA